MLVKIGRRPCSPLVEHDIPGTNQRILSRRRAAPFEWHDQMMAIRSGGLDDVVRIVQRFTREIHLGDEAIAAAHAMAPASMSGSLREGESIMKTS
jgi:hypothetical protein